MTWDQVCADPSLQNLPYKIETNEWGQIVMSPAKFWHSSKQGRIARLLGSLTDAGDISTETAIQTTKGVKSADVAWASDKFFTEHEKDTALSAAPELCVEVLSDSNTKREMSEKLTLYFAHGAQEVWFCDSTGRMIFHITPTKTVKKSRLFPAFPAKV